MLQSSQALTSSTVSSTLTTKGPETKGKLHPAHLGRHPFSYQEASYPQGLAKLGGNTFSNNKENIPTSLQPLLNCTPIHCGQESMGKAKALKEIKYNLTAPTTA